MSESPSRPFRALWRLWRGRHDNPLTWGGVVLPHAGARQIRLANRIAWIAPWALVAFALILVRLLPIATVGWREALAGLGIVCAAAGPLMALLLVPLIVLGFAGTSRDQRRMEDLYLSGLSRGEVVFGVFLPPWRACWALLLPLVVLGYVGTAVNAFDSFQGVEDVLGVLILSSFFPTIIVWAYLLSLRLALRRARVSRLHMLVPMVEVVLRCAMVAGGLGLFSFVITLAQRNGLLERHPHAAGFVGWSVALLVLGVITWRLVQSTVAHAGLRFFRAFDEEVLMAVCQPEAERIKPWHLNRWGDVAARTWRAQVQSPGGRVGLLSGVLAGILGLCAMWLAMAATWPLVFEGTGAIPFPVRLQNTVLLNPIACLAAGIVAAQAGARISLLRQRGLLDLPVSELRLTLFFQGIPAWGLFLLLGVASIATWAWRAPGLEWWAAVGGLSVLAFLVLPVVTFVRLAVAAGGWGSVGAAVVTLCCLAVAVPLGLLILPELGSVRVMSNSVLEALACTLSIGLVLLLLVVPQLAPVWCQRVFDQERGAALRRGATWRWGLLLIPVVLGGLLIASSQESKPRPADPWRLRPLIQVRFVDDATGEPVEGSAAMTHGSTTRLPPAQGAVMGGIARWDKSSLGWSPYGPPRDTTATLEFARDGQAWVTCGPVLVNGAPADQHFVMRLPPPAPRPLLLLTQEGTPLAGMELLACKRMHKPAPTWYRDSSFEPVEPICCVETDLHGLALLPPATTEVHVTTPLLLATRPDGDWGECVSIQDPDFEASGVLWARRDFVDVTLRLVGAEALYPGDEGTLRRVLRPQVMEEHFPLDGRFHLRAEPGRNLVIMRRRQTASGAILLADETVIIPRETTELTVSIDESRDYLLAGRVLERAGRPAAGQTIGAINRLPGRGGATSVGIADDKGRFQLPLIHGTTFSIGMASRSSPRDICLAGNFYSCLYPGRPITVDDRVARPGQDLRLHRGDFADVEIVVIGAVDQPVSGAVVATLERGPMARTIWAPRANSSRGATDAHGRCILVSSACPVQPDSPTRWDTLISGIPDPKSPAAGVTEFPILVRASDSHGRSGMVAARYNSSEPFYVRLLPSLSVRITPRVGHDVGDVELQLPRTDPTRQMMIEERELPSLGIGVLRQTDGSVLLDGLPSGWDLVIHGTNGRDATECHRLQTSRDISFPSKADP